MKFRDLVERTEYAIYYVKDELWLAHGQGSGITTQLPSLTKYLNSDEADTEHYDSSVGRIVKIANTLKPIKKTSNTKLYEISSYPLLRGNYGESYDIWGGKIKPTGKIYMLITQEKSTIINFFKKKNEALAWINSIN